MPINIFKMLFPRMLFTKLNKYINKKVRLCAHNNSSMPQLGICRVTIKHKNIELSYSFFVVTRNGPAVLGMPDYEKLELLSVNWTTRDESQRKGKI